MTAILTAAFTCTAARTAVFALAAAAAAVAHQSGTKPLYRYCRLAAIGGALHLTATDGQVGVIAQDSAIPAEGEGALVVAASLAEVLANSTSEQVTLSVEGGDTPHLRIDLADGSFTLPVTVGEELPPVPGFPADGGLLAVPTQRLASMLRDTCWAVDQGSAGAVLTGVQMEVAVGRLTLVATDGKVLVQRNLMDAAIADPTGAGGERTAVIPGTMIRAVTAALGAAKDATAEIACPATNICVRVASGSRQVSITGRTIQGTYPNYHPAIAAQPEAPTISVDRDALSAALRRLGAVMDGRSPAVVVEVEGQTLRLSNLVTSAGTAQVTVAAEISGPVRRMGLNAAYLGSLLSHRAPGQVTWTMGRAVVSVHAGGVDLIMPVSLP